MYACHSFSPMTPLTYIAARVADLDSLAQLIIIIHSLLPPPLFRQTSHDADHLGFNKIKKPLIGLAEVRRTQCRQERMGSTSYHCSTRGDCSTNWNGCLSMQVSPQALLSSDIPVPFMIHSLSAPLLKPRSSSTKGRFCTPLKDPGWQWGCSAKMMRSMSQEGWKGWSPCNSHLYRLNNVPSGRVAHCSLSSNT